MTRTGAGTSADVLVIGGGLIGLVTARAIAERGGRVTVLQGSAAGAASPASAGMLAPGAEHDDMAGAAYAFATTSRDRYPALVAALTERTGIHVALDQRGILELVHDEQLADVRRAAVRGDAAWIDAALLRDLEPSLAPMAGAVHFRRDGAVDVTALLAALTADLASRPTVVTLLPETAVRVELATESAVIDQAGGRHRAARLVLAAGAWSSQLQGLPRAVPVRPLRGQMVAYSAAPAHHVLYGPGAYVVPRAGGELLIGATMEEAGFDTGTTTAARKELEAGARSLFPELARAPVTRQWSGLRPVTPDFKPVIGADPEQPCLIYATGHSRNGVLMAPLTGECVAYLIGGAEPPADITPFAIQRFDDQDNILNEC